MESEQSLVCPELADHLVEEILTWLPVESLCRFRSVSQQWNALISSAKFITSQWAKAPPNRMPWLLVHSDKLAVAYCFYTGAWKKTSAISLSFLKEDVYRVFSDDRRVVNVCASGVGLVLVTTLVTIDRTLGLYYQSVGFTVCNPLTRTFKELPPMTSITAFRARGIVAGEGDHPETYKVVAMGLDSKNYGVVEIYDSTKQSWEIAPHRPLDLCGFVIARGELLFGSGFFYCLTCYRANWEIMGFSMTDGISVSKQLPSIVEDFRRGPYLVVCGSQILVVGATVQEGKLQKFIILEFEKVNVNSSSSSSQWELKLKESVTMPSSLCEGINRFPMKRPYPTMTCKGVKDCVCLIFNHNRDEGALEMITYNIREKTWTELPSCPLDFESGYCIDVFEPRPDMKVQ